MDNQTNVNEQQYVPHQPQFTPAAPAPYHEEPVSLKEWIITLLILIIPFVNFIMLFVFAFGNGKESKKNFFKAYLILVGILLAIYILLIILFGATLFSVLNY